MKRIFFFLLLFPAASFSQTEKFIVDALVKPKKQERVITVGSTTANIPGFTNQAIQIAVDALPVEGGTVKLDAGEFKMTAPVRLRSNITLTGSGAETILKRID